MIDYSKDILVILEIGIFITLFYQPSESRLYTGSIFFLMLIFHEIIFSDYDGLMYYGTAALFYFGIMFLTAPAINITKLVLDIHQICLIAIIVNAVGWVAWLTYLPPNLYNFASMILHACGIWALLQRTRKVEHGGFRIDGGLLDFRPNFRFCTEYIQKHKG